MGWPPRYVWETPVPELLVALDARMEQQKAAARAFDPKPKDEPQPIGQLLTDIKARPGTKIHGSE